jgi:tetratricopeptide (TPR) repeat protein
MQLEADIEAWSGNYDVAIEKYKKLVGQFPEDGDIWAGYFKVLSWAKEWSLIIDFMQEGRDQIVIVDDVRAVLAEAYLSLGQEEKAIEAWKGIHVESIVWRTTLLKIVDKFLSRKDLTGASDILEEALSDNKHEAYLVAKLAVVYTYQQMPGKGFEILNQFPVSHQTKYIIDIAKVEILSLTGRYEEALSLIRTLELKEDKEIGLRGQVVELECYYAMEEDEKLIEKSSLILRELYTDELFDKAKVLTLHILSQIKMGLYEESEEGIEWLSEMQKGDLSPAILTVMLNEERRDLKEYEKSIRVLGELLSKFSPLTEIVRPKLLDNIPQSAWEIADEFALRLNQEVTGQLAKAELKIGNFQKSLDLFEELCGKSKDPKYKLGMLECYLNLENEEEIDRLFEEIQIIDLSREEIVEYLGLMVKAERSKQNFYAKLSLLPKDVSRIITVKVLTIIINIQSGDYEVANELIGEYLSDPRGLSIFQVVAERIGYFDKGEISENYEFARDWLYKAVKLFPDDTGLRYQYAKQLATHKEYDLAIEQFLILQKDIPENTKILRWLAQINSWKQEYDESLKLYDLYVRKRPNDFKSRREIARVNGWALRRKESEDAYRSLCEDSPGDYEIAWEWNAKRNNWLGRKRNAISFYNKLIERHPEDPELMFDLGQMYSMLNFSVKAEDYYKKLLAYAPEHSRAAFAKESEQWRRKQSISLKPSYIRRDGGGDDFGSINITMYRIGIEYSPVRLSEAMDLSLGVGHTIFKFKGNDGADAQHLTLNLNKGFRNGVSVDFAGELSSYSENPHETAQFDVDINYKLFGIFSISLLGGREDVLQNNITLNDSRGRYYAGGRLSWDISERIDISGQAKQYWYNDSNVATEYFAFIGYKFTLYPKIFKLIIESYGFDVRSRRPEYWTPVKYRQYIAGLSWKHYLGKEHYNGAPKLFYEIAITQAVDVNGVYFMMPKFQCGWDNQRHWSMGFEFKPMRSTVYDEDRASLFFKYRF